MPCLSTLFSHASAKACFTLFRVALLAGVGTAALSAAAKPTPLQIPHEFQLTADAFEKLRSRKVVLFMGFEEEESDLVNYLLGKTVSSGYRERAAKRQAP